MPTSLIRRTTSRRCQVACSALALCWLTTPLAFAQASSSRSGLVVTPSLSVTQTVTDHHRDVTGPARSESITTLSSGVRLGSRSGRIVGSVDYALVGRLYARSSEENSIQHRLAASGRAELLPDHLDVNASASISRQPISAFGVQSAESGLTQLNHAEVRTASIRPVLRGVLAGLVGVQVSLNASATDSDTGISSAGSGAAMSLSSVSARSRLGWSLNGTHQSSDFDGGRETTTDRLTATLLFRPLPELQLSVRGGQERSDIASVEQRKFDNYGAGLHWTPGVRTRLAVDFDRRAFGNAHGVVLEHRMRRSVWRYTDNRSFTDGSSQTRGGSVRAYDLFFELFASQEPDPVQREILVRSFLERNNIPAEALIGGGFLSASPTVTRRREFSLALNGVRTTYIVSAFALDSRRADPTSAAADDLAAGPLSQRGLRVIVSHRVTPRQTLGMIVTTQRTNSAAAGGRNGLDSVAINWATALSARSNLSLSLRHSEFNDAASPYTENALTAAFTTRF